MPAGNAPVIFDIRCTDRGITRLRVRSHVFTWDEYVTNMTTLYFRSSFVPAEIPNSKRILLLGI